MKLMCNKETKNDNYLTPIVYIHTYLTLTNKMHLFRIVFSITLVPVQNAFFLTVILKSFDDHTLNLTVIEIVINICIISVWRKVKN